MEGLVDCELSVGAEDQVVSSGDLVDFLVVVIGDDSELVGGWSIVSCDYEVTELYVWREDLWSCEGIYPGDGGGRHTESPGKFHAGGLQCGCVLGLFLRAGAWVD